MFKLTGIVLLLAMVLSPMANAQETFKPEVSRVYIGQQWYTDNGDPQFTDPITKFGAGIEAQITPLMTLPGILPDGWMKIFYDATVHWATKDESMPFIKASNQPGVRWVFANPPGPLSSLEIGYLHESTGGDALDEELNRSRGWNRLDAIGTIDFGPMVTSYDGVERNKYQLTFHLWSSFQLDQGTENINEVVGFFDSRIGGTAEVSGIDSAGNLYAANFGNVFGGLEAQLKHINLLLVKIDMPYGSRLLAGGHQGKYESIEDWSRHVTTLITGLTFAL